MVAVARKLAVVLHRMWCDGTEFRSRQRGGRGLSAGATASSARGPVAKTWQSKAATAPVPGLSSSPSARLARSACLPACLAVACGGTTPTTNSSEEPQRDATADRQVTRLVKGSYIR
jgi:hypothetical protein